MQPSAEVSKFINLSEDEIRANIESRYLKIEKELRTFNTITIGRWGAVKIEKDTSSQSSIIYREIESWRKNANLPAKLQGEPPASWCTKKVRADYTAIPEEFGFNVRQTHRIQILPHAKPNFELAQKGNLDFISTGAIYDSNHANKKALKEAKLSKYASTKSLTSLFEDQLFRDLAYKFILDASTMRFYYSLSLIRDLFSGEEDVFSYENEEAGTGWEWKGDICHRKDIFRAFQDENFLLQVLDHFLSISAVLLYGYTHCEVPIIFEPLAPNFKGIKGGSRSAGSVSKMFWVGEDIEMIIDAMTRAIAGDGTGILASKKEKKKFVDPVTKKPCSVATLIWLKWARQYNNILVPTKFESYVELLSHPPFTSSIKSDYYILPNDFGLEQPGAKAGADMIYGFWIRIRMGGVLLNYLLSGSWITSLVYVILHMYFATKFPFAQILGVGDDNDFIVPANDRQKLIEGLGIYYKPKSSLGDVQKMFGRYMFWTANEVIVMITPRGLKTVTSASQIGTTWEDKLKDLPFPTGSLTLETPAEVLQQIDHFNSLYPGFFFAAVPHDKLRDHLRACFNPAVFAAARELGLFSWIDDVGLDMSD